MYHRLYMYMYMYYLIVFMQQQLCLQCSRFVGLNHKFELTLISLITSVSHSLRSGRLVSFIIFLDHSYHARVGRITLLREQRSNVTFVMRQAIIMVWLRVLLFFTLRVRDTGKACGVIILR